MSTMETSEQCMKSVQGIPDISIIFSFINMALRNTITKRSHEKLTHSRLVCRKSEWVKPLWVKSPKPPIFLTNHPPSKKKKGFFVLHFFSNSYRKFKKSPLKQKKNSCKRPFLEFLFLTIYKAILPPNFQIKHANELEIMVDVDFNMN